MVVVQLFSQVVHGLQINMPVNTLPICNELTVDNSLKVPEHYQHDFPHTVIFGHLVRMLLIAPEPGRT